MFIYFPNTFQVEERSVYDIFKIQYTLANPNSPVPNSEFVRISEVIQIPWRINESNLRDSPILLI